MEQKKFTNSLGDALTIFWTDYVGWGRATRSEYWWAFLFYGVVAGSVLGLLGFLWWFATLVPWFCLTARRLHDTNRSNWNVCWLFLPLIGAIILLVFLCQSGDTKSNKWGAPRIK